MKVNGPGAAQGPSKSDKKKKPDQSGGSFGDMVSSGAAKPQGAPASRSIAHVDALLAVQSVEDPTARASKKRMRQRAGDILSELDKLKMAMLNGNMTIGHMIDIADVVASHREKINDPALTGLMDEIDLRAQVELAKIQVALDASA